MIRQVILLCATLLSSLFCTAQWRTERFNVQDKQIIDGYVVQRVSLNDGHALLRHHIETIFERIEGTPAEIDSVRIITAAYDVLPGMERKKPFFLVRVPAYRFKDGHWERLTAFSLTYEAQRDMSDVHQQDVYRTTASASVLASGKWYKIAVAERGIYKLDYEFIKNTLGVNPDGINPAMIRVFGNGGVMLQESNARPRADDLVENAVAVIGGSDGAFNPGDYVLFYANGPNEWVKDSINQRFAHRNNLYEDQSYYFLNFDGGVGLRVENQANVPSATVTVTDYNDYFIHENDQVNLGHFGKEWWGDEMGIDAGRVASRAVSFAVGTLTENARVLMSLGSRCSTPGNKFTVSLNGQTLGAYTLGAVGFTESDNPLVISNINYTIPIQQNATFNIAYAPSSNTGLGYINYIELNTRRQLTFLPGQTSFRDWRSVGSGNVAAYQIAGATSNVVVWDVTDQQHPVIMNGAFNNGTYTFRQRADYLHEFIAFDGTQYRRPAYVGEVANQNLHGVDFVDHLIVTHPDFLEAANKLADFHRSSRNLRVLVATTTQIYNEFSSGGQDVSAIRDFARYLYKKAGTDTNNMPRYMLLFGDASYDYKNRLAGNSNYVPTFETAESNLPLQGYCTDDFFSFLDDIENIESTLVANTMDLGVGRIPVRTPTEAMHVVNKLIGYNTSASLGAWRVATMVVADDFDNAGNHLADGETMVNVINSGSNIYNLTKVYLDAMDKVSTPAGTRAPNANKVINDQMLRGTFLMNYSGHGSGTTLAHERILSQDDFGNWHNLDRLPIMVTATCEFSRYDNPDFVAAGEKLILKPDGGAVALLTTTQLVFASLNLQMNQNFLRAMFRRYNNEWPALGDAFRYGKNVTYSSPGSYDNFRKFALLGDPALMPAFPKHQIFTDSVLDAVTDQRTDTVRALGRYRIKGTVRDAAGNELTDFTGRLWVTIYDKPTTVATRSPQPIPTFKTQNNVIYKGKVSVEAGHFSFTFIAPKDLNYDFGKGRISYYAENGLFDGAGTDTGVVIGGVSDNPIIDDQPPVVMPYIGDSTFVNGGLTGPNPMLFIKLMDQTGINVSSNSVGHDLIAILDEDVSNPYILNDYYETAQNDYTKGYVWFPMTGVAEGKHTLRVRAWDINNNSGEGLVQFEVIRGQAMAIRNLTNYPNPFSDVTHFSFEHNQPGEPITVEVNIYNLSGGLVHTIRQDMTASSGSRSNEVLWDARNREGVHIESGVYLYRMTVTNAAGNKTTGYQKLVFLR